MAKYGQQLISLGATFFGQYFMKTVANIFFKLTSEEVCIPNSGYRVPVWCSSVPRFTVLHLQPTRWREPCFTRIKLCPCFTGIKLCPFPRWTLLPLHLALQSPVQKKHQEGMIKRVPSKCPPKTLMRAHPERAFAR